MVNTKVLQEMMTFSTFSKRNRFFFVPFVVKRICVCVCKLLISFNFKNIFLTREPRKYRNFDYNKALQT